MDDDGFPDAAALAILETGEIAGRGSRIDPSGCTGTSYLVFVSSSQQGTPSSYLWATSRSLDIGGTHAIAPNGFYPFLHLFNGALISLAAAQQRWATLNKGFMFGDGVDYFFQTAIGWQRIVCSRRFAFPSRCSKRPYSATKSTTTKEHSHAQALLQSPFGCAITHCTCGRIEATARILPDQGMSAGLLSVAHSAL